MNLNFNHQRAAFDKLSRLRAGALFMKMGTGKTKVAMDLIKSRQDDFDLVVWIAPASLLRTENYKREINKWSDGLQRNVAYFTAESVGASDKIYLDLRNLVNNNQVFLVVDESIMFKNGDAKRTKRLINLGQRATFRFILNGTPCTKGLMDLYWQMQFVSPRILNMTESQFAHNFLQYKYSDGEITFGKPWKRWSKPENEAALVEIIRPYIFDAELEIEPTLTHNAVDCLLSDVEQQEYEYFKNDFLTTHPGQKEFMFLEIAQLFNHQYCLCNDKINKVKSIVNKILERGEKVIIYCHFIDEVNELKYLWDCEILTGDYKGNIDNFASDKNVLICTYGCGSFGLNLQFANNIIFFSQTFNFGHKEQAIARIYRTGQTQDCNVYDCFIKNVGLEKIYKKSLDKKENTYQNINRLISREKIKEL